MPKTEPRILVVGAGPVGLTAAIELRRRGYRPRIIDRASGPAGESRAFGIHARTLEIFEPAGVTETLLAEGSPAHGVVFCDDTGDYMRIDFSCSPQKYNFVLILPQSKTERILKAALRQLGVNVEWETPLTSFQTEGEEIHCQIGAANESTTVDLLIGCDGSRSQVRNTLGIPFDGATYDYDWKLIDVRFAGERRTDELRIKTTDSKVLAYFPLAPNSGRFVASGGDVLAEASKEVDVEEVLWQSDFRISHRIVQRYQQGNAFLAGDAAHVHSPVGGRGMNLGIEDAATLAWLIETGQTQRYTSLRQPIGRKVLRFTDTQTRQVTSRNPLVHLARRYVAPTLMTSKTLQRFAFRQITGANTPRPPWLPSV